MDKVCKASHNPSACTQQADGFSGMTKLMGGGFHSQAQADVCECHDSQEAADRAHQDLLLEFFERRNLETPKTEDDIKKMLAKNKGKEGKMYYKLALQYGTGGYGTDEAPGKGFVKFHGVKEEL